MEATHGAKAIAISSAERSRDFNDFGMREYYHEVLRLNPPERHASIMNARSDIFAYRMGRRRTSGMRK